VSAANVAKTSKAASGIDACVGSRFEKVLADRATKEVGSDSASFYAPAGLKQRLGKDFVPRTIALVVERTLRN